MAEYTRAFIEDLAKNIKFKKIRELIGEAIELQYNGMLYTLIRAGKATILEVNEEANTAGLYLGAKTPGDEEAQKKRLEKMHKCYSDIAAALLSCGIEAPADNKEMYSKIIRPIFELQIKRSL